MIYRFNKYWKLSKEACNSLLKSICLTMLVLNCFSAEDHSIWWNVVSSITSLISYMARTHRFTSLYYAISQIQATIFSQPIVSDAWPVGSITWTRDRVSCIQVSWSSNRNFSAMVCRCNCMQVCTYMHVVSDHLKTLDPEFIKITIGTI